MIGTPIGKNVIELEETDSTNSYAARLLHDQYPMEGTAILAHYQTSGRGQRASGWESSARKNLLVSYILYPEFIPINNHFAFNQAVALAVWGCIKEHCGEQVSIKWPNDILVNDEKIAGILIENALRGSKIINSILGIGINVNQTQFSDYEPVATSLKILNHHDTDILQLFDQLSGQLAKWYSLLKLGHYRQIREAYQKCLYRKDIPAMYIAGNTPFTGIIKGVTDDGKLEITTPEGISHFFMNKEVKYVF